MVVRIVTPWPRFRIKKRAGLCARRRYVASQIGGLSMHHGITAGCSEFSQNEKGRIVLADGRGEAMPQS
jgi:hypothetical protein